MTDKLFGHFDKLLLALLFLFGLIFLLHALHHQADAAVLQWIENSVGQILAALLTLMVGQRTMQRKADDGNGKPPA
jgi:hypothetical protein